VRGDYFCLLHDDDTLEPRFVEALVSPLEADSSLILSFCDHWVTDADGERLPADTEQSTRGFRRDTLSAGPLRDFARAALVDHSIPAGATMYRRAKVGPDFIDPSARGSIDMWLLYRCWQTGGRAHYVPERLMNYRKHEQGMSRSMPFDMIAGDIFRHRRMLKDATLEAIHPALYDGLAEALEWYGMALLRDNQFQPAREAFREATTMRPTAKSRLGFLLSHSGKAGALMRTVLERIRRGRLQGWV
jgi:hypothetical protein